MGKLSDLFTACSILNTFKNFYPVELCLLEYDYWNDRDDNCFTTWMKTTTCF